MSTIKNFQPHSHSRKHRRNILSFKNYVILCIYVVKTILSCIPGSLTKKMEIMLPKKQHNSTPKFQWYKHSKW